MGSSRFLAVVAVVICLPGLVACGGEAESRDDPPRAQGTAAALERLRAEVAGLREALQELRRGRDAGLPATGRLAVEVLDVGTWDPFLAERSREMDYIARKWDEKGFEDNIAQQIEVLKARGHAAVAGIIPFLRDVSSDHRLAALHVLREMGVAAELAVPHIKERRRDPDAAVRAAADDALCAIHDM